MKSRLLKLLSLVFIISPLAISPTNSYYLDRDEATGFTIGMADWTAPYVKINSPADGSTISGLVSMVITVTDNDPDHYWLVIQNTSGHTITGPGTVTQHSSINNHTAFTWDTTLYTNDSYIIKLEARDASGNKDPNLSPVPADPEDSNDSVDWITVTVNNQVADPTPTPTPTGTPAPTYPDVVINEVYYDVDGSHGTENKNEWIELFNNTDSPIDLKDWYFLDDGGTNKPINSHVTIPAKGFAVFSHDSSTWSVWSLPPAAVSANLTGGQSWLNNNGDKLMLYNNSGVLQDWVAWENFVPSWGLNAPEGYSIARVTKGVDTDSPADWQVLSAPNPGTNPHPYVPPVPQNPNATPTATPTLAPAITAALSRPAYNTLRLNITNIPDSPGNTLEYQINYSNPGGIDKGVFGQVDHTQATSGAYLRSYFLGTCSSGDCISDADLSAPVYLTLTLNGTDIILRQPYNF